MAQSPVEIKMIPPRSISRDRKGHDVTSVELPAPKEISEDPLAIRAPRREFLTAVIPATGKLLGNFLRNISATVGVALEDSKDPQKKNSD